MLSWQVLLIRAGELDCCAGCSINSVVHDFHLRPYASLPWPDPQSWEEYLCRLMRVKLSGEWRGISPGHAHVCSLVITLGPEQTGTGRGQMRWSWAGGQWLLPQDTCCILQHLHLDRYCPRRSHIYPVSDKPLLIEEKWVQCTSKIQWWHLVGNPLFAICVAYLRRGASGSPMWRVFLSNLNQKHPLSLMF